MYCIYVWRPLMEASSTLENISCFQTEPKSKLLLKVTESEFTVTFIIERYRPPVLIFFLYEIYSLCKNNAISKVLNKLQVFHFCCTVQCAHKHYTNSDYTLVRVTKTTVLQR